MGETDGSGFVPMGVWRPRGWVTRDYPQDDYGCASMKDAFESGADAILEALRAKGLRMGGQSDAEWVADLADWIMRNKEVADKDGHLAFIPEARP